jgi:hypothetical protein
VYCLALLVDCSVVELVALLFRFRHGGCSGCSAILSTPPAQATQKATRAGKQDCGSVTLDSGRNLAGGRELAGGIG